MNDGACVPYCPQQYKYDLDLDKMVPNPDAKYTIGSLCVPKCPGKTHLTEPLPPLHIVYTGQNTNHHFLPSPSILSRLTFITLNSLPDSLVYILVNIPHIEFPPRFPCVYSG